MLGVNLHWTSIPSRNQNKLLPDGSLGSNAVLNLPLPDVYAALVNPEPDRLSS